jgi:putative hemolysin
VTPSVTAAYSGRERALKPQVHIVDELIAERAPRLSASPLWPLARPLLYAMLGYRRAVAMADAVAGLPGEDALAFVSALLDLKISAQGLHHVPRSGPVILVANHPTGIADGLALYDAILPLRPDVIFYANADALRVSPRLAEAVIPVEWLVEKRTREKMRRTLDMTAGAIESGRALAIFPAGRIARLEDGRLTDPPWAATPVTLARRHGAPLVPVHMSGPASTLFRLFDKVSVELRDITLFHEMLNKSGQRFDLIFGPPIPAQALPERIEALKHYVEQVLPLAPDRPFA